MTLNSTGRGVTDASISRPEPREPRAEARAEPRAEARAEPRTPVPPVAVRPPEAKAPEPRPVEVRVPETRAPEVAPRASVLGPSLRFKGELSAQEDLIVQGSVEGSISHTQSLTIGGDGSMKGDIRARVIVVDGKVDGNLYATERVIIRSTGRVKGNLFAPHVAITEGAFFQGQIDMKPSAAAAAAALDEEEVDHVLSGTGK
jgi:cytoskeletal protein CcmA (bactofilin family)